MTTSIPICLYCKHYQPVDRKQVCSAFPGGIPRPILFQGEDHTRPYFGDHGIQFELADDVAPEQFRRHFPRSRAVKSGRI